MVITGQAASFFPNAFLQVFPGGETCNSSSMPWHFPVGAQTTSSDSSQHEGAVAWCHSQISVEWGQPPCGGILFRLHVQHLGLMTWDHKWASQWRLTGKLRALLCCSAPSYHNGALHPETSYTIHSVVYCVGCTPTTADFFEASWAAMTFPGSSFVVDSNRCNQT